MTSMTLICRASYRTIDAQDVLHTFMHGTMSKEDEHISFARRIALGDDA
jgi:hypothetical protein